MKRIRVIIILLFISFAILGAYRIYLSSDDLGANKPRVATLSQSQKNALTKNPALTLAVSEDLLPIAQNEGKSGDTSESDANDRYGDKDRDGHEYDNDEHDNEQLTGYLYKYVNSLLEPYSVKIKLVRLKDDSIEKSIDDREIDGLLMTVNDDNRNNNTIKPTFPIFALQSGLFVNESVVTSSTNGNLFGYADSESVNEKTLEKYNYEGKSLSISYEKSMEDSVVKAVAENKDFVIGDMISGFYYLNSRQGEDDFSLVGKPVHKRNVSFFFRDEDSQLFDAINIVIQGNHNESFARNIQGVEYGIPYSFAEEDRFSDVMLLIIIVFSAVLITFLLYYLSNRNLYKELSDSMGELRSSQNKMSATLNSIPYYVAEMNLDGKLMEINKAFSSYTDRQDIEDETSIYEALSLDEEATELLRKGIKALDRTETTQNIQLRIGRNIIQVRLFPIEGSKEYADKILFMANDVTGEIMAERQMVQGNKMIAIGQLAAGVAHEIRNPLGVIRNQCYILRHTVMADDKPDGSTDITRNKMLENSLNIIENSAEKVNGIIHSLLNFSKDSPRNLSDIELKQHIQSLISINEGQLHKSNIQVILNCPDNFPVTTVVESLDMIIINLISNAMEAIGKDGTVEIHVLPGDSTYVIEVRDDGPGISEDIMDEIFHPFFTTKQDQKGIGLGLYVVYNEVDKLDGKISVESKTGKGTVFRVTLPVLE